RLERRRGCGGLVTKDQHAVAMRLVPFRKELVEADLGRDLGHAQDLALLGGLYGMRPELYGVEPWVLNIAGDHRLDDPRPHLGRLLDFVVEPLDRSEA